MKEAFHPFVALKHHMFSLVAGFHLKFWDVCHKTMRSISFGLLSFQQLFSSLLFKVALSTSLVVEDVVFFSVLSVPSI